MSEEIPFEKSFASHEKAKYWSDKNKLKPNQVSKACKKKYWFECDFFFLIFGVLSAWLGEDSHDLGQIHTIRGKFRLKKFGANTHDLGQMHTIRGE